MSDLATRGFHHITLVCGDARRTLAFYRDVLGLRLVKQTVDFDDPRAYHLYLGTGAARPGSLVTFLERPDARSGRWGIGGIHHLALGVDGPEAQLKWKRRLTDRGTAVSGPFDRGYFRSIYFADPDGQILEIATAGPGYAIDEPADALGETETLPPGAELRGQRDEAAIRARTHPEPVERITPGMRLRGIHHISGITDDIDRAHAFYTRALGLRRVKKSVNQDDGSTPHWFWARYDGAEVAPHSALSLFGWKGSDYPARPGAGQTHHIAFRARGAEEQLAWREHLLSEGVRVTPVMDRTYFTSIYFRAPDGLLLEIATDGPGLAVDEPEDRMGADLMLPEWLENRREEIREALAVLE